MDEEKNKEMEIEHQESQIEYLDKVDNADLSLFDLTFVELYRTGSILINNKLIELEDMFIEIGMDGGAKRVMLIDFGTPNLDQATLKERGSFIREDVMLFRNTLSFYKLYMLIKDKVIDNTLNLDLINKEIIK